MTHDPDDYLIPDPPPHGCDDGHVEIFFYIDACPLCEMMKRPTSRATRESINSDKEREVCEFMDSLGIRYDKTTADPGIYRGNRISGLTSLDVWNMLQAWQKYEPNEKENSK